MTVRHVDPCLYCARDGRGLDECAKIKRCPACGHDHDHGGCPDCECEVCPTCVHMHGESEVQDAA